MNPKRLALVPIAIALACALLPAAGLAEGPDLQNPNLPEGFQAISGKERVAETVDASAMVTGAYAAIFVLVLGFVGYVARLQQGLRSEVAELKAKLEKFEKR